MRDRLLAGAVQAELFAVLCNQTASADPLIAIEATVIRLAPTSATLISVRAGILGIERIKRGEGGIHRRLLCGILFPDKKIISYLRREVYNNHQSPQIFRRASDPLLENSYGPIYLGVMAQAD